MASLSGADSTLSHESSVGTLWTPRPAWSPRTSWTSCKYWGGASVRHPRLTGLGPTIIPAQSLCHSPEARGRQRLPIAFKVTLPQEQIISLVTHPAEGSSLPCPGHWGEIGLRISSPLLDQSQGQRGWKGGCTPTASLCVQGKPWTPP